VRRLLEVAVQAEAVLESLPQVGKSNREPAVEPPLGMLRIRHGLHGRQCLLDSFRSVFILLKEWLWLTGALPDGKSAIGLHQKYVLAAMC
jgi:hypothetical protein